jgi:hypothetical protein
MKVVMLEAPEELLEERRRKGHDRHDEMWEGVLHMVPPPSGPHQRFGSKLFVTLEPIATRLGLVATYETGLFRPGSGESDYRQPDLLVTRPEHRTKAGAEGAEVVFEYLSPNDESREKLGFYEDLGANEFFLIDPESRVVELFRRRGEKLVAVKATKQGFRSAVLGVSFKTVKGPKLLVRWKGGEVEI